MESLDILYTLVEDPDSYWIVYDLCLLNGWANLEGQTFSLGHYITSRIKIVSTSGHIHRSIILGLGIGSYGNFRRLSK
jgi:hypothetical protein